MRNEACLKARSIPALTAMLAVLNRSPFPLHMQASDVVKKGKMCSLFINDLDAGAGRMGEGTQYTVNNQMVRGAGIACCPCCASFSCLCAHAVGGSCWGRAEARAGKRYLCVHYTRSSNYPLPPTAPLPPLQVNATLMNIADNPTNVQLPGMYNVEDIPRVPIIATGERSACCPCTRKHTSLLLWRCEGGPHVVCLLVCFCPGDGGCIRILTGVFLPAACG